MATAQQGSAARPSSPPSPSSPSPSKAALGAADLRFIKDASAGGMAEVELGKLAVARALDDNVRKFGQKMVDDHSKANDELQKLAASKGLELRHALSAKNQSRWTRLSRLKGEQFDKAYMAAMVKDHKEDVAAFQRQSNTARDRDVKDFAARTLPTLQEHLKNAEDASPKMTSALRLVSTEKPSPSRYF